MTVYDDQLDIAARVIVEASYVIALVGAGMSKESGIPTFRGGDGLWDKHGQPPMDGYQRLLADPEKWAAERAAQQGQPGDWGKALDDAQPNPGHYALAELERLGHLQCIITQNIDNLHHVAGSTAVAEIHGNRTKQRCIGCMRRWGSDDSLDGLVMEGNIPRCPDCDGIVKGDTVMFGEPIPQDVLEVCFDQVRQADCMLLLGTSAAVVPAAEFPVMVYRNGGRLIEVNPQETHLSEACSAVLRAPTGEVLPKLVEHVAELIAPR